MFFAFYNFSRSLRTGSISTNAPIFRLSFTLTAALAMWLLHEPLTLIKLAGLGLALIAVLALAGERRGRATRRDRARLADAACCSRPSRPASATCIYKVGLLAGLDAGNAAVGAGLGVLFAGDRCSSGSPTAASIRRRAGFRYGAMVGVHAADRRSSLLLNGLAVGPASVLIPVAQLGFVFTAVLGRVLFARAAVVAQALRPGDRRRRDG